MWHMYVHTCMYTLLPFTPWAVMYKTKLRIRETDEIKTCSKHELNKTAACFTWHTTLW